MNDIILRAIKRAQIPTVKEPVDFSDNGKHPDGVTNTWAIGKSVMGHHSSIHFAEFHLSVRATETRLPSINITTAS